LPTDIVVATGLATPESALYDAATDTYLVSNINGTPFDKDDNGYIARVTPDGKAVTRFIDGDVATTTLNAPKGMAIVDGKLYVADIDTVRIFDATSGKPVSEVAVPGAVFLNDVAADGKGGVLVSDSSLDGTFASTGADAIYRVDKDGKVSTAHKDKGLAGPNGLAVVGERVFMGTFGSGEFGLPDGKREQLPTGQLDGIVVLPGADPAKPEFLVSSWAGKAIYRGAPGAAWTKVVDGLESPADIGWDASRKAVLIPAFMGNALIVRVLS
jgi:hypothetical protein